MKRLVLSVLLVGTASGLHAEDLFCQGNVYANGEQISATRVFSLDKENLQVSVQTNSGPASGDATAQPEIYMGRLYTTTSQVYWFNLNRYSGTLFVVPILGDNKYGTADFNGTCRHAEKNF